MKGSRRIGLLLHVVSQTSETLGFKRIYFAVPLLLFFLL